MLYNIEFYLFYFYQNTCPTPSEGYYERAESHWENVTLADITWNYEKILVDRKGKPRFRALPHVVPQDIEDEIDQLLAEGSEVEVEELENVVEVEELENVLEVEELKNEVDLNPRHFVPESNVIPEYEEEF